MASRESCTACGQVHSKVLKICQFVDVYMPLLCFLSLSHIFLIFGKSLFSFYMTDAQGFLCGWKVMEN